MFERFQTTKFNSTGDEITIKVQLFPFDFTTFAQN
jgi:hypothetical protein